MLRDSLCPSARLASEGGRRKVEEDGGEGHGPLDLLRQGDILRREDGERGGKVKGNEAVHELLPA